MARYPIDLNAAPLHEQIPASATEDEIGFPFGWPTAETITNPWLSPDTLLPATPEKYGFAEVDTGGGCMAWEMVDDKGEGQEYLITDGEGGLPTGPGEAWELWCHYAGNPLWCIHVDPDGTGWVDVEEPEVDVVVMLRDELKLIGDAVELYLNTVAQMGDSALARGILNSRGEHAREIAESLAGWE